jgi:L-2-hydroxyglutarate oxidase LhgO
MRAGRDRICHAERSAERANVIWACGIRSTGIASALAVADLVRELLTYRGLR